MRSIFVLSLLFAAFAAAPASAQGTTKQRTACTDDAYKFCEKLVPNAVAVEKCLRSNFGALSRACRQELSGETPKKKKRARRR